MSPSLQLVETTRWWVLFEQVRGLSNEMLMAVEYGQWERLAVLIQQHRETLIAWSRVPVPEGGAEMSRQGLAEISTVVERIQSTCGVTKEDLGNLLFDLKRRKQATVAYQNHNV